MAGQEKTQVQLLRANKFCSWVSENGRLVVRWASEIIINHSGLVRDNFHSKTISKLKPAR